MFEELVKAESLSEQIEPQWQRESIYIYSVTTFRQTWRGISIEITQNTGRMRNLILILRKTRPALPSALWNAVDWASNVLWFKRKNCLKREKWRVNNSFHLSSICPCFVSRFIETFSYALTKYKLWYRLQVDTACWLVAVCPCSEVQSSPAVPISNRVGLSTFCNTLFLYYYMEVCVFDCRGWGETPSTLSQLDRKSILISFFIIIFKRQMSLIPATWLRFRLDSTFQWFN